MEEEDSQSALIKSCSQRSTYYFLIISFQEARSVRHALRQSLHGYFSRFQGYFSVRGERRQGCSMIRHKTITYDVRDVARRVPEFSSSHGLRRFELTKTATWDVYVHPPLQHRRPRPSSFSGKTLICSFNLDA
jgi:hypothetical protein